MRNNNNLEEIRTTYQLHLSVTDNVSMSPALTDIELASVISITWVPSGAVICAPVHMALLGAWHWAVITTMFWLGYGFIVPGALHIVPLPDRKLT
jgi:hypothetical protein